MNQVAGKGSYRNILTIGIVILILLFGLGIWLAHRSNNSNSSSASGTTPSNSPARAVNSLVSYTLPDGWIQNICPAVAGTQYVIPNGVALDCSADPSSPVKIYVDSQNTTDCQQLKPADNQGIKKHVCISLYIDGHKSLKASTTRSGSAGDTTVSDYYINTGRGVVAIEYDYTSANAYQAGFDQLAQSVHVKS